MRYRNVVCRALWVINLVTAGFLLSMTIFTPSGRIPLVFRFIYYSLWLMVSAVMLIAPWKEEKS